jgi:hypothetical protein
MQVELSGTAIREGQLSDREGIGIRIISTISSSLLP